MSNTRFAIGRRLVGALGFAALCVMPAAAQPAVSRPTVLVFPFDRPENIDPGLAETVSGSIRTRLRSTGKYEYMVYNTRSALVNRAIQSGSITREQSEGPFEGGTGATIARSLGLDYALTGTVDASDFDVATNTATVTVTGQLVTAKDGRPVQTAAASGTATEAGMAADALLRRASDNAAEKVANQIFGEGTGVVSPVAQPAQPRNNGITNYPSEGIPVETRRGKKSNNLLLLGGVALLGIIIASAGGGGGGNGGGNGGGGGGTGGPPPLPF